jgi:phage shock protein A
MNRMRLVIASAALLSMPLVSTGCEDAATTEALKTCSTNLESIQKSSSAQEATLKDLKKQLAEVQGKIGVLTKENEDLKAGKPQAKSDAKSEPVGKGKKK